MLSKKLLVGTLALLVVAGGIYYGSGSSLQGKFGGAGSVKPSTTTVSESDTKSMLTSLPRITVSYTTNEDGVFARKSMPTSNVSLGSFSLKLGKGASELNSCDLSLGMYNDGSMYDSVYDSSVDPNPSFVKSVAMQLSHNDVYVETESAVDTVYSSFHTDFTSLLAAFAPTSGSVYKYTVGGKIDPNSELGVDAGDTANYEANTGYVYLTSISCYYSGTSGASRYTWDATDSQGQNSNFSVSSYDKGKGILLTNVVVGN